jgi:hypothetical protein
MTLALFTASSAHSRILNRALACIVRTRWNIPSSVKTAAAGVKLYHKEAETASARARELLRGAKRVCFLGFSYNPFNLARLNIGGSFDLSTTIIGTARGLIGMEVDHAKNRLAEALGGQIGLMNDDNLDILRRHMFLG